MRRLLALGVLVLAVGIVNAQAATITFEDLALDPSGAGGDRDSSGFHFDSANDHIHVDDGNGGWGTSNGTKFMLIDDVGNNPNGASNLITILPIVAGPFGLSSIDISEAGGAGPVSTYSHQIEITGNLFSGGTIFRTLTLDFDAITNPSFGFETFTFDSGWDSLSSVVLKGVGAECCGPAPGNYYAIDNVAVDLAEVPVAVPEPGTLSLLGLGSAYLFGRRRRNRR